MSLIADILPPACVVADMVADGKRDLLEQVGALFEMSTRLPRAKVVDSLLAREKLGSTAMGNGIAIPHGRIKGLRAAAGVFVRLKTPIPFDAPDERPVNLVFALLVPEHANEQHLLILGELAQLLSDQAAHEQLLHLSDATDIHRLLTHWPD